MLRHRQPNLDANASDGEVSTDSCHDSDASSRNENETSQQQSNQPTMPSKRLRIRRARSAPPILRRPLLEEHFRVDPARRVVLPGVPKHGDDWARDSHDFFNLVVLIPVVALNIMNWDWEMLLNMPKNKHLPDAWTGEWFDAFLAVTILYFLVDLAWIVIIPKCVRSPATIIQHHVVTILYILVPLARPDVRWCMGACMIVEINTWFLIARRVFNKQGFHPWVIDLSFFSIRVKLISICFYISWISIRCILYPILWLNFVTRWRHCNAKEKTIFNIELIPPVLHTVFCALNFKWTYDLCMSKLRYWRRKTGVTNKDYQVSKGL